MLHAQKDEESEDGEIQDVEGADAFWHLILIGWKLLFAIVPPAHYAGGWLCFVGSLAMIGVVTAVVGEFATLFGCVLGIKPSITAITFVALGTSLPDTFASMAAAKADKYADAAVGNVTGSNSVNVFLGLGLPWLIAATSSATFIASAGPGGWSANKQAKFEFRFGATAPGPDDLLTDYYVPAGSLGFSVVVFCSVAVICVLVLLIRRCVVGGELGGSAQGRLFSCGFLCFLWFIYVVASILQTYKIGGLDKIKIGAVDEKDLSPSIQYWLVQCDKSFDYKSGDDNGWKSLLPKYQ
jgi:solute carrier family 8 (sodium/calcium exchanger)